MQIKFAEPKPYDLHKTFVFLFYIVYFTVNCGLFYVTAFEGDYASKLFGSLVY